LKHGACQLLPNSFGMRTAKPDADATRKQRRDRFAKSDSMDDVHFVSDLKFNADGSTQIDLAFDWSIKTDKIDVIQPMDLHKYAGEGGVTVKICGPVGVPYM
jgi:hypothetical protein